jgi:hypothetical protein
LLGLAYQRHTHAIIFRRVYPNLEKIVERSKAIYSPDGLDFKKFNETFYRWRWDSEGKLIRFAAIQHEKNKFNYQGRDYDLHGFDEITEFSESQFRYVTNWNRTAKAGQRPRVVCTCNPPMTGDGEWIIPYWGPWLDPKHPRPAKPGELRWFSTIKDKDIEVPDNRPFVLVKDAAGKDVITYDFDPEKYKPTEIIRPRSRTFIPASVEDNPYYLESGYVATLQALPEPMRSKMLKGDFAAGREDNPMQVIPTAWIEAAQERWRQRHKPTTPISCLGVDVARGGADKTVISPRYDNYFAEQNPGAATPDGPKVAEYVIAARGVSSATVNIDVIGVGSSPYDSLKGMIGDFAVAMCGSEGSDARDKSDVLGFINQRAEWWWSLRESLEPESGQNLAIPDDTELKSDLCAPRWKPTPRGIQIESKDDIIKRIGRSPDKGDSLVYAHAIKSGIGDNLLAYYNQLAQEREAAKETH